VRVIRPHTTQEQDVPQFRKDPDAISRLTPEQFRVTQLGATEYPGSEEYLYNNEPGIYVDAEAVTVGHAGT